LSANLNDKNNLNKHLFTNLEISGVPKELSKTVFPFIYNDFEYLKKTVIQNNIKIIKMEVIRNQKPEKNFLKKVREFCTKNKIVLIFDECTTGFRETYGGYYKKFSVTPDILIYGKALGNGFPITAVLSKKKFFEVAKKHL
jgi:glutamate-1-semialdehyde 2,1-aminomutase